MPRSKHSLQKKLDLVLGFKESTYPLRTFARKNNIVHKTFRRWVHLFDQYGIDGLKEVTKRTKYSYKFKLQVVTDYLEGKGSLETIAYKYGFRNTFQVSDWVFKYNNGKLLKDGSPRKKNSIMKKKITFEERIEIVEYVVKGKHTYKEAAEKYSISYQQVRSWVLKSKDGGYKALIDGRGHRKAKDDLTELDEAHLKIRELESQLKDQKLIEEFAKKLQEIQHRG